MYLPRAFAEPDLTALDDLIARDNFITLITVHDGVPVTSHLPVLYQREGDNVELRGHWARPNPQSRHAGRALAIVHGPHAYVSPSWYPDKEEAARVPTWNYAIAHLQGDMGTFDDEASLAAMLDDLSRQHESRSGSDWRYDHAREDIRSQLRGIIGFRMTVDQVTLKFKLSQNHPLANRIHVLEQLERQPREASRDVALLMRDRMTADMIGD
jgi:transcriptional regulator